MEEKKVHGLEIIKLIEENKFASKDMLKKALEKQYGQNIKIEDCKGQIHSFEEITSFMQQKDIVSIKNNLLQFNAHNCPCKRH